MQPRFPLRNPAGLRSALEVLAADSTVVQQ
jgi:hypothetical protein